MTNLKRYLLTVPVERAWEYVWGHGCESCPALSYCHARPVGTCCRENFFDWAELQPAPEEGEQV